jgi:hypothetical protein
MFFKKCSKEQNFEGHNKKEIQILLLNYHFLKVHILMLS